MSGGNRSDADVSVENGVYPIGSGSAHGIFKKYGGFGSSAPRNGYRSDEIGLHIVTHRAIGANLQILVGSTKSDLQVSLNVQFRVWRRGSYAYFPARKRKIRHSRIQIVEVILHLRPKRYGQRGVRGHGGQSRVSRIADGEHSKHTEERDGGKDGIFDVLEHGRVHYRIVGMIVTLS